MVHEDHLCALLGGCGHSVLKRATRNKDPPLVLLNGFYRHRIRCVRGVKIATYSAEALKLQNAWCGDRDISGNAHTGPGLKLYTV